MSNEAYKADISHSVREANVPHAVIQAIEGLQRQVSRMQTTAAVAQAPATLAALQYSIGTMELVAQGEWTTGLGPGNQFDGSGALKAGASGVTSGQYIGAAGARGVYLLETDVVVAAGLGQPVVLIGDAVVTENSATGTLPAAGGLLCSFDIATRVVLSSPAYLAGAAPNTANDALNRYIGQSALSIELTIGVSDIAPNLTGLAAQKVAWQVYAIRGSR